MTMEGATIQSQPKKQQHDSSPKPSSAGDQAQAQTPSTSPNKPQHKKKVGRSKSVGGGVRRMLGAQWSQRLQSHLKNKLEKGPGTTPTNNNNNKTSTSWDEGEASNPDLLAQLDEEDLMVAGGGPASHQSTSRFDQSITGEIISAGWLLSPKKSSKNNNANSGSANNSNNNSASNIIHNSYSNLQDEDDENPTGATSSNSKNATPTKGRRHSSDTKSTSLFVGSSSTLFTGVNDFLNMSSGPLSASFSFDNNSSPNHAKEEFDVVRQTPPRHSSGKMPGRLSAIASSMKNRPVLAPKLAKQLTDFRLRRQQQQLQGKGKPQQLSSNQEEEEGEDDDDNDEEVRDGTEHFSVTTEKLSAHTITSRQIDEFEEDQTSLCSDVDDEEGDNPAKSPVHQHSSEQQQAVRNKKLNASETGEFQHVENLLSSQKQRYEMMNEIEMRREKFKAKLLGTTTTTTTTKDKPPKKGTKGSSNIDPATLGAVIGKNSSSNNLHESSMVLDFVQDLQESLLMSSAGNLMMGSAGSLMGSGSNNMAFDTQQMVAMNYNKKVKNTGRRPRRAQSTSAALALHRSSSLPESMDTIKALPTANTTKAKKLKKTSSADQQPHNLSVVMDDLFDDDDSVFFGNKAGGKKQSTTTKRTTTGSSSVVASRTAAETMTVVSDTRTTISTPAAGTKLLPKSQMPKFGRSRTTSSVDGYHHKKMSASMSVFPTVTSPAPTESTSNSTRSHRTTTSERSGASSSMRSDHTSLSTSNKSNNVPPHSDARGGNSGSLRSQRTHGSADDNVIMTPTKRAALGRRATVAITDFDKSFQIVNGVLDFGGGGQDGSKGAEDDEQTATSSSNRSHSKKKGKKGSKDATALFHQSFALESLVSPVRAKRNSGTSMPNVMADQSQINLILESSFSLLSTVDEISKDDTSEKRHKPKRRNSLPTGSSHGPGVDLPMPSPRTLGGKPKVGVDKRETTPKPRKGRRHSLTAKMGESVTALQLDLMGSSDDKSIPKSRSTASLATASQASAEEDERIMATVTKTGGIAPSKADALTLRRRASVVKVEPVVKPEPKETTVDKIRMRRRASTRVTGSTEKGLLKQRPGIITRTQSTPSETTTSNTNDATEKEPPAPAAAQRRKDRKSRRHTTSQGNTKSDEVTYRRTTTPQEGASTSPVPGGEAKKSSRSLTPSGVRRRRRATHAEGSQPKTPTSRKERVARRSSVENEPRSPVFNDPSVPRVRGAKGPGMDESATSQNGGRSTPIGLRRVARAPRRQTSMDESATTRSDRSEISGDGDDDSFVAPTPKPKVPPSLPQLSMRGRSKSPEVGVSSSRRRGSKPRRHKSQDTSPKMKDESRSRRQTSDNKMDGSDIVSPSARRRTRNRRHTAHEVLKGADLQPPIASPDPAGKLQKEESPEYTSALAVPNLTADKEAKPRQTMDKKLMAELCKSPNKANRFRRRKTQDDEAGGVKEEPPKSPKTPSGRRPRRTRGDGATDAKSPYRRRRTDSNSAGDALTPRSRLRRVKTVDTPPLIDIGDKDEADGDEAAEVGEGQSKKAITNKALLNGLSF